MEQSDKAELKKCISDMRTASDRFYISAVQLQNHPFIEFTGLMNEYIQMCSEAIKDNVDFRMASVHTEHGPLKMYKHNIDYVREKLECIFGEQIFIKSGEEKSHEHGQDETEGKNQSVEDGLRAS